MAVAIWFLLLYVVCSLTFLSFYLIAKALQFYWLWFISYFYLLQN